ncbi:MAG TPA: carboxypeptidase-like regulatory domain-containing protein [Edaphobacter sp.]|nr:carboxypeptidase-like regulatory domain-containing protein [Edaphobacter sp.]HMG02972.1 carboxypeptidase-like regulatory domain-containing protein [Edaphobacter sp.]
MRSSTLALWPLFLSLACPAQTANRAPEPNGIVTGRVFCGDTGHPARFASVSLMPVPEPAQTKLNKTGLGSTSKPAPGTATTSIAVNTALDGSYTLVHIAPGTYYVIVRMNGYISPLTLFSKKQLDQPTDQERALIDEALPRVHIEQDSTAHADVQLQRGAAVSGTISYDDETPAVGVSVLLRHKDENGKWMPIASGVHTEGGTVTNDRGNFHLSSLLPGTYLLDASLSLGEEKTHTFGDSAGHTSQFIMRSFKSSLAFYGDGTPHMDQATSFTLRGDEERTGQDMTIPISKLHKIIGRVAAGPNGHFVNAASIELISITDKKPLANANIEREDGLFHFEFVPEGDYTLRVTNARDVTWEPATPQPGNTMPGAFPPSDKERVLETYGNTEMPLLLNGDMTDIVATIPAKQNQSPGSN